MAERRSTSNHGLRSGRALLLLYIFSIGAACEASWSANKRSTGSMIYMPTDGLQCVSSTEDLQTLPSGSFLCFGVDDITHAVSSFLATSSARILLLT
jgi:hypothetical protein